MSLMNPIGTMVGFVIPYAFVDTDSSLDTQRNQFFIYLLSQTGLSTVIFALSWIFIQSKKDKRKKIEDTSSKTISNNIGSTSSGYDSAVNQEKYDKNYITGFFNKTKVKLEVPWMNTGNHIQIKCLF